MSSESPSMSLVLKKKKEITLLKWQSVSIVVWEKLAWNVYNTVLCPTDL